MNDAVNELELDCTGMLCPRPVIELAKAIGSVPAGGVIAVLADDVAAEFDIPAWCRMREQEYLGAENRDGGVRAYRVRRTDPRLVEQRTE